MVKSADIIGNENYGNQKGSLFLFIGISLIIIFLGIIVNRALRREIVETRTSELESIAQLKVNQITDFRNERYSEARFLDGNQTFINSVFNYWKTGKNIYAAEIRDWLSPILNNHQYRSFTIIENNTWNNLFSVGNDTMDWSRLDVSKDGARKCLEEESIVFGTLTKYDNIIFIPIFIPLIKIDDNQRYKIGVVEFILDPEAGFYNLMQTMPSAGKSGEILLVKKDGENVIFLNQLRFSDNASLTYRLPITTPNLPAAKAILSEESSMIGTDYRGHSVLAISKTVPDFDWKLVVKKDTNEIFQGLRIRELFIYSSVALIILSLGLLFRHNTDKRNLNFYKQRVKDLKTISKLSRLFKFLNNVERAIVKNTEKENLLSEVCNIIFNEGDYALCWVGLKNQNTGNIECLAQCGFEKSKIDTFNYYTTLQSNERESRQISFIDGENFISNDIVNDTRLKNWHEKLEIEKFRSMAVFPLMQNSALIGSINLFSYEVGFFKTEEIELFSQLCDDISYALDKIDLQRSELHVKQSLIAKELELTTNELKLVDQNKQLGVLNDKYYCANENLKQSNERIKKVNQDLIIARERAEESARLKSAFIANLSHEIRSPMNAIIGFAELMNSKKLTNSEIKEFTSIIILKSNELLHLINDILDISKLESNTTTLYYETVSLNDLLSELNLVFKKRIEQSMKDHLILECMRAPENLVLTTDLTKFKQIFNNLLENAIKFTDSGKIQFGYLEHNYKQLICFVRDTGIGIDAKYHDTIFEIFRQAKNELNRNFGGTGLGLAICKGNANLLGGDISVESEEGKGSIFTFSINFENSISMDEKQESKNKKVKQGEQKKILLIEDDYYTLEYMKRLFHNSGFNLSVARNGKETQSFYKVLNEFDLVLLDMRLPDANGLDLVKQIKEIQEDLPVIAQTAFATEEDRLNCLEAGCDEFITKPFKKNKLFSVIESFLA
jgi:signal transduction histidine kinase/CheY-like chemotaxis protein